MKLNGVRTKYELCGGDRPPRPHLREGAVRTARHPPHEEAVVEAVLVHVPPRQELAHDYGHKGDGVLEARAVVDRFGVYVYAQQAQRHNNRWDCCIHGVNGAYMRTQGSLTYPPRGLEPVVDGLSAEDEDGPDSGPHQHPNRAVGEGMHGGV